MTVTLVVDASVLVSVLVEHGERASWAENIVVESRLTAPEIILVETTNVLRRLERAKLLTSSEANAARRDLVDIEFELFPFAPFADRIWALRANLTSYDAWYVALAEYQECPFATFDLKLSKAVGPQCRFLLP